VADYIITHEKAGTPTRKLGENILSSSQEETILSLIVMYFVLK